MQYANVMNGNTALLMPEEAISPFPAILDTISNREDLSSSMAEELFSRLMSGTLAPEQVGAALLGLRCKGETSLELAVAAKVVLRHAVVPAFLSKEVIDVVGTGGDGKFSFNCSTVTALTLAGMGNKVVKHGNRSVSSKCGSADVLERLGIKLDTAPDALQLELDRRNFAFLFAPEYHPAFRHIMPVRRKLGVRTIFNLLGPLVNPAQPKFRLIGVPTEDLQPLFAGALAESGNTVSAVVCGAGGFDELTPLGPSLVYLVRGRNISTFELDPAIFGFARCTAEDVAIQDAEEGELVVRALLSGNGSRAMCDMAALNVGLALFIQHGGSLHDCMEQAKTAIQQGVGRKVLDA